MSVSDGSIALSFTALQSAESQLSGNLSTLRSRLAQLEAELTPLVQSWSGDAQVAYLVQKRQWEQAADDLAMMLGAIVTGLNNTNTDFSGTQRRIVAAFSWVDFASGRETLIRQGIATDDVDAADQAARRTLTAESRVAVMTFRRPERREPPPMVIRQVEVRPPPALPERQSDRCHPPG